MRPGANLRGANLRSSRFPRCDATGSDFANAQLDGADFSFASLDRASFRGAAVGGTTFLSASLDFATFDGAVGLERADLRQYTGTAFGISCAQPCCACRSISA